MSKISCTRKLEFDAAHRIAGHENKCKHLHGHRYVVEATFEAQKLDTLGRVIDFGCIKELLGDWLDEHWDHTTILAEGDKALGENVAAITHQQIFYLKNTPTAENMALYLLEEACPNLFKETGIQCVAIRLYETPNCYADVSI